MFTGSAQPAIAGGEGWRLARQRALREAHGDDLDGNESAPYGLSVPANPRILQMRGQGKGTRGRGGEQRGAGAGKQARSPLEVPSQGTDGPTWHRRRPPQVCSHHRLSGFVPGFRKGPCPLEHPLWVSFCLSALASVSLTFSLSLHVSFHLHFSVPILPWPSSSALFVPLLLLPTRLFH